MEIKFTDAKPTDSRALIGIAGPQGSGKTVSALRLATGIVAATGGDILYADTENRRSLKYSESFKFRHFDFEPPFTAERYLELVLAADKAAKPGSVIIIDSMSHEHEGMGGMLERSEEFLDEACKNGQEWKRDKMLMASLIKPKMARTRLIQNGLQRTNSYIILCFRAKEKVKPIKTSYIDGNGQEKTKTEVVNLGWQIVGGVEYGYEVDVMFILPPGAQGKPDWQEESARINDVKGDLIKALKATPQIDEGMGKKIREFFSVKQPEPTAAEVMKLKQDGDAAAKKGAEQLKAWWEGIGKENRKTLGAAYLDELKAVAAKAAPATTPANEPPPSREEEYHL